MAGLPVEVSHDREQRDGNEKKTNGQPPVESPGTEHSQEPTPWREELKSNFFLTSRVS